MEEVNVDTLGFSILKVDNIVEVENSYKSRIIVSSNKINAEEAYIRFFNSLFDIYKEDGFIVDFYINRLTKDEVNYLRSLLCEEDKLTLDKIVEYDLSGEFFKINSKELIDFFVRLSTREVFFISYYTKDFTI
ncbi:MAG: hypothetical protein RR838_10330, partial [Clostridium sp.]